MFCAFKRKTSEHAMDPVIHAEMTILVKREKTLEEELVKLEEELPVWKKRVQLALEKDMMDLAEEAKARYLELQAKQLEAQHELEQIEADKKRLRYEARRPTGEEVRRSAAMLEAVRQGGLIDPDEAKLDAEFEALKRQQGGLPELPDEDDVKLDFES